MMSIIILLEWKYMLKINLDFFRFVNAFENLKNPNLFSSVQRCQICLQLEQIGTTWDKYGTFSVHTKQKRTENWS